MQNTPNRLVLQVSQMAKSACVDIEHACKEKIKFVTRINEQQSEIRYEGGAEVRKSADSRAHTKCTAPSEQY